MTVLIALLLQVAPVFMPQPPVDVPERARRCFVARLTGYVRGAGSARTFDGTSIYTGESIAAAGWNIPLDTYLDVEGVGTVRIADRGHLGNDHIDVAVWSLSEAYALGPYAGACYVDGP